MAFSALGDEKRFFFAFYPQFLHHILNFCILKIGFFLHRFFLGSSPQHGVILNEESSEQENIL
jgi:hypothetical protein